MTSIPSPAAATASGSSVTVEDEAPCRRCCICCCDRPESDFSGAQLKKKGKRVCKECVERREWKEAKEADQAAAAKSAADSIAAAATTNSAAKAATAATASPSASSAAATAVCIVCGKGAAKLRTCSRCHSHYCGVLCLKKHSRGEIDLCAAIRTLPPLTIADEDRITEEEIEVHWPRIKQRMISLMSPMPEFASGSVVPDLAILEPYELAPLVQVYPPHLALPWWNSRSAICEEFRASVYSCLFRVHTAIHASNKAFFAAQQLFRSDKLVKDSAVHMDSLIHDVFFPHVSPFLDESRFFHRLMRCLIYYYRHIDSSFLSPQMRSLIDVQSDDEGVLLALTDKGGETSMMIYCTHVDTSGRHTLLPIRVQLVKDRQRSPSCGVTHLQQGGRLVVWMDGALVNEPGLMVRVNQMNTNVTACTGRTTDPATTWCMAPATMMYATPGALQGMLSNSALRQSTRDEVNDLLAARRRSDYFHLVPAMREALADQWPDPSRFQSIYQDANLFIATPRPGLESDLAELLLLESLAEEAEAGDSHSRLLVDHIESECGATIGEVIAVQRSRLEQMLKDQQDQLRLHAEAVARHDQRGRIKMRLKEDGGSGSDGSSGVSGVSGSSSQSASASSCSAAQLDESIGELSLSSTAAAGGPISPSAGLSRSSASSSTGSLSRDRSATVAVTNTATVRSAAACSWTAAHRSLESLRAPGRQKYGPIMKAALRFLHSLRPVAVNRSGGSHLVFHFAAGGPVTLVQPHAGGRSKDNTKGAGFCTRLYHSLHAVALQQLQLGGGVQSAPRLDGASSSSRAEAVAAPTDTCSGSN